MSAACHECVQTTIHDHSIYTVVEVVWGFYDIVPRVFVLLYEVNLVMVL